jgi:hypothetical protein
VRKPFSRTRLWPLVFLSILPCGMSRAQTPAANLTGDWSATFGDSTSAGTLAFHMTQDAGGNVSGTYTSTLGGAGLITGSVSQGTLTVTLAQTQSQCPGTYQAKLTLSADGGDGTFGGKDCLGSHENGVVSMRHKTTDEIKPAGPISRDKDGNVQPFTLVYQNGLPFWLSRSDSSFLAVGAQEVGGYFRLLVLVSNTSDQPFNFIPSTIRVDDLNENKVLPYVPPSEIAAKIEHRMAVASALMAFGNGMQAYSQSMVTAHTTGTLSTYDSSGTWVHGSYFATTTTRVPVDHAKLAAANAQNRAVMAARADQRVEELNRGAIGAQTIPPKSYVLGTTMFRKPKTTNLKGIVGKDYKSYFVRVLVPIGDNKLIFLFPVELLQALPHPQH